MRKNESGEKGRTEEVKKRKKEEGKKGRRKEAEKRRRKRRCRLYRLLGKIQEAARASLSTADLR